ncbi:MAG: NrdJb, partial [Gammaproteobacteria bacterium]
GGKYMPSLVAEIGDVIESHMRMIGLLKDEGPDEHQRKLMDEKRAQYEANVKVTEETCANPFPESASLCPQCQTKAMLLMDNCLTCLNCGYSKCG